MRAAIAALIGSLAAAAVSSQAPAQQPVSDQPDRQVIGLVLSGGGARGGAHLGVIKALEELHVPIDLIAGTSIGAAIGGLYASGMTVEELDAFINGIDWDSAFLNATPRQLKAWQRKREDDLYLLQVKTGTDEGLSLPLGVVQGQVIDTIMSRITLPVASVDDFEALAIPFRAVAGDISTGRAVILTGGNLARVIRASMAVPAILAPIEIGDKLLVDGGIAMNLPVEVAQQMGAQRIIAVDISEKLTRREDIRSVLGVTGQLTSLLTTRGTTEQIERLNPEDILLRPEISDDISSVSFGQLADTVKSGYDSVMAQRELFEPLSLSPQAYAAWKASLPNPRRAEMPVIEFLDLGDTSPLAASVVEWRMQGIEIGRPLDLDALETALNRVYGLGIYQNVRYTLVEEDGKFGLKLETVERSKEVQPEEEPQTEDGEPPREIHGDRSYGLGLSYTSTSNEDARFGLAASFLRTGINELGSEWRGTFLLGDEPGFTGYRYQPFGSKGLNFFSPSLEIGTSLLNVFTDEELTAEYNLRSAVFEMAVGRELLDWAEVRAGFRVGAGDTRLRVGDPDVVPYDDFHRGESFARLSVDTLDDISFPREGVFAKLEWRGSNASVLGADHDYDQILISVARARSWGKNTFLSSLRYDTTISGQSPAYALFGIGGFRDLSGLNSREFTGQHVTRLGASYYREIKDLAVFRVYMGANLELGNAWENRSDIGYKQSLWGGSIWAGVDTPVGPVFVSWGSTEDGDDAIYVFLGRLF